MNSKIPNGFKNISLNVVENYNPYREGAIGQHNTMTLAAAIAVGTGGCGNLSHLRRAVAVCDTLCQNY